MCLSPKRFSVDEGSLSPACVFKKKNKKNRKQTNKNDNPEQKKGEGRITTGEGRMCGACKEKKRKRQKQAQRVQWRQLATNES
jgi:hypothetical protein